MDFLDPGVGAFHINYKCPLEGPAWSCSKQPGRNRSAEAQGRAEIRPAPPVGYPGGYPGDQGGTRPGRKLGSCVSSSLLPLDRLRSRKGSLRPAQETDKDATQKGA